MDEKKTFYLLIETLDIATNNLFKAIDSNNSDDLETWFKIWKKTRNNLYDNKFNQVGHKLASEIIEALLKNNLISEDDVEEYAISTWN